MRMIIAGVITVTIIATIYTLVFFAFRAGCYAKWEDSGYESRYALFSGCRIKKDGKWVPSSSVRLFDD